MRKKVEDEILEAKHRRVHGFESKPRNQIYLKNTTDAKVGTYGSGIAFAVGGEHEGKENSAINVSKSIPCTGGGPKPTYGSASTYCSKRMREQIRIIKTMAAESDRWDHE